MYKKPSSDLLFKPNAQTTPPGSVFLCVKFTICICMFLGSFVYAKRPQPWCLTPLKRCVAHPATNILHDASADSDIKLMSRSTLQRLMRHGKALLHNHQVKNIRE